MASSSTETADRERPGISDGRLPEFVDWLLGVVIALAGLVTLVAGSALELLVDREMLAEDIEEGTVTVTVFTTELTEAETLDVTDALVTWLGIGLLLIGLGLVLFAIGFVIVRHRTHRRAREGEEISSYGSFAVLGGVATALLSFIPFSPVVGGAIAGFLERYESTRTVSVGTLAGFLPVVPILVLLGFVFAGLIDGMQTVGQEGMALFLVAVLLLSGLIVALVGAGLGAIGGYLGGWIAESRSDFE